jgi:RHS repeat-associated protein
LPGIQAQTLTDVSQLAAATAWRSRRIDPTGFYYLGARYYEPTSGRFLSADPMGHASSPSLYDYAGGDPVNRFDRDGRDPAFTPDMPNIFSGLTPTQEIEASRKAEKTAPIVIAGAVIIFAAPEVGALATTAAGLKLLGIAAGAGVGAAIVGTAGADAWNGKLSSWQTYTSNAFGGGAGGVVTVATGSPLLGGAFSGDVSTLLDDLTNGRGYNPDRATFNTGLGGLAGKATDWFAPYTLDGINSGSNSLESISHQIATKTLNGTIEDFSYATATKIGIYETIINLPKASAAGGLQGYLDSQLFKENTYVQQDPTGKHTKLR